MVDERLAVRRWRELFLGGDVTPKKIVKAEELLKGMNPESPLRFRLATELADIRTLHLGQSPKRRRRMSSNRMA